MKENPLISIITVTFNDKANLLKTLKSLKGQTYNRVEFIVIDGGSSDGTVELIRENANIISRWISERDQGIYDAMNKGIALAGGDYINFLNAGDYYCDEKVIAALFDDAGIYEADVVYGDHYIYNPLKTGHENYLEAYTFSKGNLLKWGTRVVCHQAFFVKRSLAPRFDTNYRFKAELNWYFDIVEQNPHLTVVHKKIPVVYYATGGMAYRYFWKNQKEYYNLIRKRYGFKSVIKYKHYRKIAYGLTFRYEWLKKLIPKRFLEWLKPKVE